MALELKNSKIKFYASTRSGKFQNTQKFLSNKYTKGTKEHLNFSKALKIENNNLENIYSTIIFLNKKRPNKLNGKLISAQFDNLKTILKSKISESYFTLRRIDNFFFFEKNKNFK